MPEAANPFGIADARLPAFCGHRLSRDDWEVIREIIDTCGLSRWQLAMTICECLGWLRPNGNPKTRECFEWLGVVGELGVVRIPAVQARKPQAEYGDSPPLLELLGIEGFTAGRLCARAAVSVWWRNETLTAELRSSRDVPVEGRRIRA